MLSIYSHIYAHTDKEDKSMIDISRETMQWHVISSVIGLSIQYYGVRGNIPNSGLIWEKEFFLRK